MTYEQAAAMCEGAQETAAYMIAEELAAMCDDEGFEYDFETLELDALKTIRANGFDDILPGAIVERYMDYLCKG